MVRRTAVGIDDDFAPGEATVAHRTADDEFAGGVDVEFGFAVQPFSGQDFVDNQLTHRFLQVFQRDVRVVLGGEYDGINAGDFVVFVAEGDLRFRIRTQPRQHAIAAHLRLPLDEAVRVHNGRRHQRRRFVAGVAEHQSLVACPLFAFFFAVNALCDVGRLLADGVENAASGAVKANVGAVVADIDYGLAYQIFQIDPGGSRHLTGEDDHAGFNQRFAGDAGVFVLGDDGVQDCIGNLVGDFVRMPFGYRFGCK